jgi:hypothetical protein
MAVEQRWTKRCPNCSSHYYPPEGTEMAFKNPDPDRRSHNSPRGRSGHPEGLDGPVWKIPLSTELETSSSQQSHQSPLLFCL